MSLVSESGEKRLATNLIPVGSTRTVNGIRVVRMGNRMLILKANLKVREGPGINYSAGIFCLKSPVAGLSSKRARNCCSRTHLTKSTVNDMTDY